MALIVQPIASPKVVNNTEATVELRNAPTNSVKTDAQVAAAPVAPSTTAASSAIERQRRRKSCQARSAVSSELACSIDFGDLRYEIGDPRQPRREHVEQGRY